MKTVIKRGNLYSIIETDLDGELDFPDFLYLVDEDGDPEDVLACAFVRVLAGGVLYEETL